MKKRIFIAGGQERFQRYAQAVREAGCEPVFPERVGAQAAGCIKRCHALLLPGGGDIEPWRYGQANTASRNLEPLRDAWEQELLRSFVEEGKAILGICRGMQSINVFFGGTLLQDIPSHGQVAGADRLHRVRSAPGPFAAAFGAITVNSAHHQAVECLGDGLRAEQWAEDGVIEALRHKQFTLWGVQWHPERLPGAAGKRLFHAFFDLLP